MDREKAFKIGSVRIGRAVEIRCVIADLTSRGAKIILDSPETLPPTVTLKISTIGLVRNARVAWQIEREAGLTFRTQWAERPVLAENQIVTHSECKPPRWNMDLMEPECRTGRDAGASLPRP